MHASGIAENAGKALEHAISAAHHSRAESRVGVIKPGGQANSAGDRIELGDAQALLADQKIRTDDARDFVLLGRRALDVDQTLGLANIEPLGHPRRLPAFEAFAIKKINGAIKLQKHAAKRFKLGS